MYSRGRNKGQEKRAMTADPSKYPQGYFKPKPCKECKNLFTPMAPCHGYCCGDCSAKGNTRKYLKKNYNISYEFYMEMYAKFDGMCHICRSKGFKIDANQRLNLVVDHCHITGLVRGMLCHNCNRALELFQDNTQFLNNAVEYLERATTILNGSTLLAIGSGSAQHPEMGDDIV